MKNLKLNFFESNVGNVLTRNELKNIKGGYKYLCFANTSCCGIIGYSPVDDQDMQAWYAVYAAAGDNPQCVTA